MSDTVTLSYKGHEFHLGYSRLSEYIKCPRSYEYSYVLGHRGKESKPATRGNVFHYAVDVGLNFKIDTQRPLRLAKLSDLMRIEAERKGVAVGDIAATEDALRLWHETIYPDIDPIFTEEKFSITRNGVTLTGRVDCGTRSGSAIDWKFGMALWTDERAKNSVQPIIYQWAWEDLFAYRYGIPYKRFEYQILASYPTRGQTVICERLNAEKSAWYENMIRQVAEAMIADVYFPRPDYRVCASCHHRALCKPPFYRIRSDSYGAPENEFES